MDKLKNILARPQVWGFLVSVAAMALIAIAFFYPENFQGKTLQQPDMVQGAANGHEAQAWQEATGEKALWTNSLFGGMPTFQISPSYPSNRLFEWVNTVYGLWLPAPSNLLFMMMMGFFILMYCLRKKWYYALIGAVAWGFSSYFVIILGAGHIWKFLALTYIPPTIGGFILLYRGRYVLGTGITAFFAMMQLSANHPQMSYYFAILMAIIAVSYLVEAFRRKHLRRWLAASGLAVLAGALALGANAPSLYNTYEYAKYTKRAQSELAQPAAEAAESAERPTGGMPKGEILGWSYGPSEMFSLVVPNIKGGASAKPQAGQNQPKTLAELNPTLARDYILLEYLTQYFNDSEGTNGPVYVGAIIAALFILGCFIVRGPLKWALLAATVVSCILALGYNAESLSDFMIYHFPLYNKFRAVESILVVAEFTMPLLAVLALCKFIEAGSEAWRQWKTQLSVSFGIPALIALIALIAPSAFGSLINDTDRYYENTLLSQYQAYYAAQGVPQADLNAFLYEQSLSNPATARAVTTLRAGLVRADGLRSFALLALAFLVLAWRGSRRMPASVAVAAIGTLVLVDLYGIDKRYVDSESFTQPLNQAYGITPDAIDNAILADTTAHYRVLDMPGFDSPRRSYYHSMVGGYHAAKLNRYDDLIREILAPVRESSFDPTAPADDRQLAALKVADMLNAKYIITPIPSKPLVRNAYAMGNAWLADSVIPVEGARQEIEALKSADISHAAIVDAPFRSYLPQEPVVVPGDTIYLTYYSPNTLRYHASTTGSAIGVFSEVYFPWGWKATIDGQPAPLYRVNYILRALTIPAGSHEIAMTFAPDSIRTSGTVAYASVSLIYMLLLGGLFVQILRWRRQ